MSPARQFSFDRFRLDPGNARLWRSTQALPLTLKAFAVLHSICSNMRESSSPKKPSSRRCGATPW